MIKEISKEKIQLFLRGNKYNFITLSVICTLGDILLLREFYILVTLVILLIWFLVIYLFKFSLRSIAFIITMLFILISFSHILGLVPIVEKSAIWAYLFLIIYSYFLIKADRDPKNKNPD